MFLRNNIFLGGYVMLYNGSENFFRHSQVVLKGLKENTMARKILFSILMLLLIVSMLGTGASVSGQSALTQQVYLP